MFQPKKFPGKTLHVKSNGARTTSSVFYILCKKVHLFLTTSIRKHFSIEKIIFSAKVLVRPKTCKWDSLHKTLNSLQLASTLEVADSCKYKEFSFGTDTNIIFLGDIIIQSNEKSIFVKIHSGKLWKFYINKL
jgi:hypothetical protein